MSFLFNRHSYSPPRRGSGADSKHGRRPTTTFTRRQLLFEQQRRAPAEPTRNVSNTGRNRIDRIRNNNNNNSNNQEQQPQQEEQPQQQQQQQQDDILKIEKEEKEATEKTESMKSKTEKNNESALGDLALASADFASSFEKAMPTTSVGKKKKVQFNLKKNINSKKKKSNISMCVTDALAKKQRLTSGLGMKSTHNIASKKIEKNTTTKNTKKRTTATASSSSKKIAPTMKKTRKLRKKPKTPYETVTCGSKK